VQDFRRGTRKIHYCSTIVCSQVMNRKGLPVLVFVCGSAVVLASGQRDSYIPRGVVSNQSGKVSVAANDPRPLDQAMMALREYYGWKLDYEDPVYSAEDVMDDTDPAWRQSHPGSKRVTVPKGGAFSASYPGDTNPTVQMTMVVDAIVQQYNATTRSSRFVTKSEGDGRIAVLPEAGSVLDTEINLPKGSRSLVDEVHLIMQAISDNSGQRVTTGYLPSPSGWANFTFDDGGETSTARARLLATLAKAQYPLVWRMLYDFDHKNYFFNLFAATQISPRVDSSIVNRPLRF
jgi:hypothetical protein